MGTSLFTNYEEVVAMLLFGIGFVQGVLKPRDLRRAHQALVAGLHGIDEVEHAAHDGEL